MCDKAREVSSKLLNQQLRPAILRKDFIVDEYQLFEAKIHGVSVPLFVLV